MGANCEQLRSDMIAEGYITQEEVDQDSRGLGRSRNVQDTTKLDLALATVGSSGEEREMRTKSGFSS